MGDVDRAGSRGSTPARWSRRPAALPERPEIASAALEGSLSGEQLEALVQVATPDTDPQWAVDGPGWSASSLRAAARNRRAVTNDEALERDRRRELGFRWNETRGELRLWGRLPDVDGALVALALSRGAEAIGPDPDGHWDPFPTRCAEVLVSALGADLAADRDPPRATVVVHTPEAALHEASDVPGAYVDGGDATGVPIALGRRIRTVPAHLHRLLRHRDRHCRAPGCHRTRGLHAHHVVHWADGGPTELANLILLGNRHHHLLHEHRWQIRGDPARPESVEFRHRDGGAIAPHRPPPLHPGLRERFLVSV